MCQYGCVIRVHDMGIRRRVTNSVVGLPLRRAGQVKGVRAKVAGQLEVINEGLYRRDVRGVRKPSQPSGLPIHTESSALLEIAQERCKATLHVAEAIRVRTEVRVGRGGIVCARAGA